MSHLPQQKNHLLIYKFYLFANYFTIVNFFSVANFKKQKPDK